MEKGTYLIIFLCLVGSPGKSQAKIDSLLIGTWKGTSICQIKNSPCHDEVVVYHISKGRDSLQFDIMGYKMVNGREVEMGLVPCSFNKASNELVSSSSNGVWTFKVSGGQMEGRLISKNELYRIIKVSKTN